MPVPFAILAIYAITISYLVYQIASPFIDYGILWLQATLKHVRRDQLGANNRHFLLGYHQAFTPFVKDFLAVLRNVVQRIRERRFETTIRLPGTSDAVDLVVLWGIFDLVFLGTVVVMVPILSKALRPIASVPPRAFLLATKPRRRAVGFLAFVSSRVFLPITCIKVAIGTLAIRVTKTTTRHRRARFYRISILLFSAALATSLTVLVANEPSRRPVSLAHLVLYTAFCEFVCAAFVLTARCCAIRPWDAGLFLPHHLNGQDNRLWAEL
ncbi:hypothetical protein DFH09DRAFT_197329 [Mycena vulgaris]|nr:hypothetical protein DFH09DRAFT_197329 [Mycena vulgaris]